MACFHPLTAYRLTGLRTEAGKSKIVFSSKEAGRHPHERVSLPCGRCVGCRVDKSRQWAVRCIHEASLYDNNCFITLTINDENLMHDECKCSGCIIYEKHEIACPPSSLCKKDFQLFMKRLRKRFPGSGVRYYHCGEYGSDMSRPHHHACLFNFDFGDKILWQTRQGVKLYRSAELESLWPFGFCTVGNVTFESAAYVARYILKKMSGVPAEDHYREIDVETGEVRTILPEFTTMSRRPGIGREWYAQFSSDVFPKGYVTVNGHKVKSPKYYDDIYDRENPDGFEALQVKRRRAAQQNEEENFGVRLKAREKCLVAALQRKVRS